MSTKGKNKHHHDNIATTFIVVVLWLQLVLGGCLFFFKTWS
jgi:hypothetical protein